MGIEPITMYHAVCDGCGKHIEHSLEFYAHTDDGPVVDGISDGDDYALEDGRTFHEGCLPDDICKGWARTGEHDFDEGKCVDCGLVSTE